MMHTRAVHTTRQARRANVEDQEVRPTSAREASRGLAGARLRERAITRPLFSVCIARARDLHAHEGPFACDQMDSPPMLHGLAERTAPLSSRLVGVAVWWNRDRTRLRKSAGVGSVWDREGCQNSDSQLYVGFDTLQAAKSPRLMAAFSFDDVL